MSSTNTLTIRVCGCSRDGIVQSCNVEAYVLPIGLSMGALIAILACIILLLGELFILSFIYIHFMTTYVLSCYTLTLHCILTHRFRFYVHIASEVKVIYISL